MPTPTSPDSIILTGTASYRNALSLKAAITSNVVGGLDGWLEVNDEAEVREAVRLLLKLQDRDTRHACAEAVCGVYTGERVMSKVEIINAAHAACMNARAV